MRTFGWLILLVAAIVASLLVYPLFPSVEEPDWHSDDLAFQLILILAAMGYLLPTVVGMLCKHPYLLALFLVNLFLGGTGIGWVGALVFAVWPFKTNDKTPEGSEGIRYKWPKEFEGSRRVD